MMKSRLPWRLEGVTPVWRMRSRVQSECQLEMSSGAGIQPTRATANTSHAPSVTSSPVLQTRGPASISPGARRPAAMSVETSMTTISVLSALSSEPNPPRPMIRAPAPSSAAATAVGGAPPPMPASPRRGSTMWALTIEAVTMVTAAMMVNMVPTRTSANRPIACAPWAR